MDILSCKTPSINKAKADKKWLLVDAENQTLGRLSTKIAKMLRGKHKPSFTPHSDCGDNVVVINAEKIHLSGKKWDDKTYIRHTGYPGGQRVETAKDIFAKDPTRLVEKAVKGMLPKNKLGKQLFSNLKVFVGVEHKYMAQKPKLLDINEFK